MNPLLDLYPFGILTLKNRVVMAPMTRARAGKERVPNGMMMEHYAQRASAGLIITEGCEISPQGSGWEQTPGIHTVDQVEGWKLITSAVHTNGGKIFLQLWHTGRASHSYFQPGGAKPVSSFAKAKDSDDPVRTDEGKKDPEVPHQLTQEEIASVVVDYKQAASLAKEAGFDGVEIHAANGYLIDQFLRDGVNERDDDYGGSPENRSRFLVEVLEAVLEVWEKDRVGVRLSPTNPFNSMSDSDPVALFTTVASILQRYEIGYLHLLEARPDIDHPMAQKDVPYLAPKIREIFTGPLMLNAGYDYESASKAIADGDCDLIAFGVPYIANPDLVERFVKDAPLNEPDQSTFYTHEAEGYLDYPLLGVKAD